MTQFEKETKDKVRMFIDGIRDRLQQMKNKYPEIDNLNDLIDKYEEEKCK